MLVPEGSVFVVSVYDVELVEFADRLPFEIVKEVLNELAPRELVLVTVTFAVEYPATKFVKELGVLTPIVPRLTEGLMLLVLMLIEHVAVDVPVLLVIAESVKVSKVKVNVPDVLVGILSKIAPVLIVPDADVVLICFGFQPDTTEDEEDPTFQDNL